MLLAAESFDLFECILAILNVEARVNGNGICRAHRLVDDVKSIFHHGKCTMQCFSATEAMELLDAGPIAGDGLGADLPVEYLSIKGLGPVDAYNGHGEPAHLAV